MNTIRDQRDEEDIPLIAEIGQIPVLLRPPALAKIIDDGVIRFRKLEIIGQSANATDRAVSKITFDVSGYPPASDNTLSILDAGHRHAPRVRLLLEAAQRACGEHAFVPIDQGYVGLDVVLRAPGQAPSDATNFLGGVVEVLTDKSSRTEADHLGNLVSVRLFRDGRQVKEAVYRGIESSETGYTVTVRATSAKSSPDT